MPRIQFTGQVPAAPPGYLTFVPDEVREVSQAQADHLCRNVHFQLLDEAPDPALTVVPDPATLSHFDAPLPAPPDPAPVPAPDAPDPAPQAPFSLED